ncbi:MAG TPA: recombination mediator RecR [Geobacteraceae bacterium]|nr:recombination mediator RecR [Geobacteraceae bacterium]
MLHNSKSLTRLIGELKKLPGIGEKSATRLAFHLLRSPDNITALAESLLEVRSKVRLCSVCFSFTEDDPCEICSGNRDDSIICVVEEPQDVLAIERSGAFRGTYHVLHGVLSPLSGITPDDLRIPELLERLTREGLREVVIATNFSVEGEATAIYLTGLIRKRGLRVTRLAHGIPIGSDLEYVDAATMQRALQGRSEM